MNNVTGGSIARGATWIFMARMGDRLIGLISTLVLARLLTPADFGLIAMAMSVIALIELASAFGFEISLVRMTNPARTDYDTVWTLNLMFGVGCAVATAAAALPAAIYYSDGRLVAIMLVLALSWAFGSLENVGIVDFRRELDFRKEFSFMMWKRLTGFTVTITLALMTRSYWALIAGTFASRAMGVALSYAWHPHRPRPCLVAAHGLFSFSLWILVEKLTGFANARSADFVLGRTHGPAALGVYRLGEDIGYLPGSELVAPLNRAFLPGISRLIESGRAVTSVVTLATGMIALPLVPACLGLAALGDPIVRLLLGPKWLEAVPVVQIMALNALFVALWANQQTALLAVGQARVPALVGIARLLVFAPCVLVLTPLHGPWGVAISALASSIFAFAVGLKLSLWRLPMPLGSYLGALWRPLAAGLAMTAALRPIETVLGSPDSALRAVVNLGAEIGAGALVYTTALAFLYLATGRPPGAESYLIDQVRSRLRAPAAGPVAP